HEFLAPHVDALAAVEPLDLAVAVQDPCHLRHVQRVHEATRTVLRPFVRRLVELDDDGLCCGAGGAYSVLQPELAGAIRDRKLGSIERAAADVVASANPGCSMHLHGAGVAVRHPIEIVHDALTR
ncbi:MAG TPA: heterodisulfide reductase-related iron-sulfur binding cluster, partial [Acidimicrobiia bacterium]|nr:heterodisulfide reductase-related iron-sulfur binding cluster [Acidimicrobiia bacterium]